VHEILVFRAFTRSLLALTRQMAAQQKQPHVREQLKCSLMERHFNAKEGGPYPGHLEVTSIIVQDN
jgi:hypothetical protein